MRESAIDYRTDPALKYALCYVLGFIYLGYLISFINIKLFLFSFLILTFSLE